MYDSAIDGLKAVAAGARDAMVYDAPILRYLINNEPDRTLLVLPQTFERQYYAFGLPEGSELRERINRILVEKTGRPEWQNTLQKYLGE
jgi:ABC-type amino acid transport substrate-binding protein